MPKTSGNSHLKKQRILGMLEVWMVEEKHRKTLREMVKKLTPAQVTKAKVSTKGASSSIPSTLTKYLAWFRGERKQRSDLLEKITPASKRSELKTIQTSMLRLGQPLTNREIKKIFKSTDSLATYLASLSVAQLETYKEALEKNVVGMPPPVKKTLQKLINKLQEEQFKREQDWAKTVGPLATGLAKALEIQDRITALEKLQASYPAK